MNIHSHIIVIYNWHTCYTNISCPLETPLAGTQSKYYKQASTLQCELISYFRRATGMNTSALYTVRTGTSCARYVNTPTKQLVHWSGIRKNPIGSWRRNYRMTMNRILTRLPCWQIKGYVNWSLVGRCSGFFSPFWEWGLVPLDWEIWHLFD